MKINRLIFLSALTLVVHASAETLAPDNADQFPEMFFPGIAERRSDEIVAAGLAKLYPGKVLDEAPAPASPLDRARPYVEKLPKELTYFRLRSLDENNLAELTAVLDEPVLVVDVRFLEASRQVAEAQELGRLWAPDFSFSTRGDFPKPALDSPAKRRRDPVIFVVNEKTAGPIEATLDLLQAKGHALLVGSPTAGTTGRYAKLRADLDYWVIVGEVLGADERSLISQGAEPEISLNTTIQNDFRAYQLVEDGASVGTLMRGYVPQLFPEAELAKGSSPDPVLQRALEATLALQTLGRMPARRSGG